MNWRQTLKVGDKLIYRTSNPMHVNTIQRVSRVTKTMIVLNNNLRFNIETGNCVGETGFYSSYIEQPTEDNLLEIQKASHRRKILAEVRRIDFSKLSDRKLELIIGVKNG